MSCCMNCDHTVCPDCYQISFEYAVSAFTKKPFIPILYLPWWDNYDNCLSCSQELTYIYQKPELSMSEMVFTLLYNLYWM